MWESAYSFEEVVEYYKKIIPAWAFQAGQRVPFKKCLRVYPLHLRPLLVACLQHFFSFSPSKFVMKRINLPQNEIRAHDDFIDEAGRIRQGLMRHLAGLITSSKVVKDTRIVLTYIRCLPGDFESATLIWTTSAEILLRSIASKFPIKLWEQILFSDFLPFSKNS